MKRTLFVPRSELRAGIARCLVKARRLNADAQTLLDASSESITHASVLFSYAVEEIGKAALLADTMTQGTNDPVRIEGFYEHPAKLRRAEELVGEDAFMLSPAAFDRRAFSRGFQVGTYASELVDRFEALYVDWQQLTNGGRWRPEPSVDATYLRQAIERLRRILDAPPSSWTQGSDSGSF